MRKMLRKGAGSGGWGKVDGPLLKNDIRLLLQLYTVIADL